ncbi:MAG TPA: hypothetical protein VF100_10250, partial [Thermoanaerobaculia bacterium]
MASEATTGTRDAMWRDLAALGGGEAGDDRVLLDRLLELWRQALPAQGAAAYVERDGAFLREATAGAAGFPPALAADPAGDGFALFRLPGALLLATGGGTTGPAA